MHRPYYVRCPNCDLTAMKTNLKKTWPMAQDFIKCAYINLGEEKVKEIECRNRVPHFDPRIMS